MSTELSRPSAYRSTQPEAHKVARKKASSYAKAGVDIDEMMAGLAEVKKMVRRTEIKGVISDIGSFGGMFASPGKDQVLVASTDGVGTKLKVALMAKRHNTVGRDLVNHCVNDILTQGARPLFFLDYLGTAKLKGHVFKEVVSGLCAACRANGCALLGGETAEMPGLYPSGEYDLVGTIIGAVPRKKLITGREIKPGDALIGLTSNGLHTNGYSLARKIIFDKAGLKIKSKLPGTKKTIADTLLAVHKSYLKPVSSVIDRIHVRGMAHITGGGLLDNIPRILPAKTCAVIDMTAWKVPKVFQFIEDVGHVDSEEMYRVFNMGIGYVLFVRKRDEQKTLEVLKAARCKALTIGHVTTGAGEVELMR